MSFVPTTQQIADILPQGLFKPNFELLVNKLGIIDVYAPTWGAAEDLGSS